MELSGSAAVVTGGGSGLGAATARALARRGARVAVLDANPAAAKAVADECGGFGAGCDVTDPEALARALDAAASLHGPPRLLVTCAGISIGRVPLVGGDPAARLAAFERAVRVNLTGTLNAVSLAADRMVLAEPDAEGERGLVVLTSSVAAFEGQSEMSAYAASKGAVAALALPCARELAPWGIRVNTIAPGYFDTPLVAGLPDYVRRGCEGAFVYPRRFGVPQEYADLVVHLAENRMLNGATIRLDGGMRPPPTFAAVTAPRPALG